MYLYAVKFRFLARPAVAVILACCCVCCWEAQAKVVRLRNQLIPVKPNQGISQAKAPENLTAVSGLFLLQVKESLPENLRQELKAAGVDVLSYVPENTFLVRCHGTRLEEVRSLPFVAWLDEYRPEHKIHRSLQPAQNARAAAPVQEVTVLLAPRAQGAEIAETRRAFNAIRQESTLRSGTVLRGALTPGRLEALARSSAVLWIEPDRNMRLFDEVASKIVAGDGGFQQLYTDTLGFDGAGVRVAVADSGLDNGEAESMHPDLSGRTPGFFHYGTLTDAADEHSHGTHVAGIIAGNGTVGETDENGTLYGLGVAPGAEIIGQRIFDGVGNYEPPPSFEKMTRDATRAGADIGSNSWGDDTQGRYDVSAMEFDELVRDADALMLGNQQYILEFSAGNAGPAPQTIGSPAVAKNVIATGASQNDRADFMVYDLGPDGMADFSSRGPCEDGRIKPDIVAPGTWIASLQSSSATDEFAWAAISPYYQYQGGTSQAGPHASGAAAVFVQYYRSLHSQTPSPALVKAALINCAVDMDDAVETGPIPNMDEGWGRIDVAALVDGSLNYDFIDQTVLMTNGQVFERRVLAGFAEPLKVTLAYTDVPGFPGAVTALVNDLDLEVTGPDGRVYRGNQFLEGESVPDANANDAINNVEQVLLYAPTPGEYVIRVRARNVFQDARDDTPFVDQDFALVISGETPAPGVGTLFLNRPAYKAGTPILLTLVDTDLAGQGSATVTVRSTTETAGEPVLLVPADQPGSFTGMIATVTGPAVPDNRLQIAHNDLITIQYFDVSSGVERTATARGDLMAPVLSNIADSMQFGQTLITWQTDEPADSVVRFGPNASLGNAVTNTTSETGHSVILENLVPGTVYYFLVISTDAAGNTATNNNGGALFSFVARQPRTLLLVDAYTPNSEDPFTPLETYTDTLNQIGVSYDIWSTLDMGRAPNASELRPYRAVIWRLNDGIFSTDTLSAADQGAIEAYLNSGGSFFLAAMEQLTRLGAGRFRSQILRVADFGEDFGIPQAEGEDGDIITSGLSLPLDYSHYHTIYHEFFGIPDDLADSLSVAAEATPIFFDGFGSVAGLRYSQAGQGNSGRLVFLPFPLDAVSATDPEPNNRATLLRNILKFLVPGFDGNATVTFGSQAYTIPSTAAFEVGDMDLLTDNGTATVASTSQPNGLSLPLEPTAIRGLFHGTVDLIAVANPPTPGKLRVQPGDQVWVDYHDVSSGVTLRAMATIDVVPPVISEVEAEPDYREAAIYWNTSERANSTVQFGESILLGRTASDPVLTTSHAVLLPGLAPAKTYYYQVTSRDEAGNVTIDNNNGALYTFTTLTPLLPPWFDDLNSGGANWSVVNGDESQSAWALGVPAAEPAHSPPAAWGSNLTGAGIDYVETFLISPAIYLTNGNVATLSFWHNYEFADFGGFDIEAGQLLIITNNSTAPVTLADYSGLSGGWQQEEVNLTPHIGKVVYIVWYYLLLAFEGTSHPGWLVDDVAVNVTSIPPGTIRVTNNLAQSIFVVSGPTYRKGKGADLTLTNAPPGEYTIEYGDVEYYLAPPPQTNTLASGQTILFTGNYTFPDVNHNNIPDGWETQFFGTISSNRTSLTDTDGDGMTDYAEFVAGTDPNAALPGGTSGLHPTLRLTAVQLSNGNIRLSWPTKAGRGYRLLQSPDGNSWTPLSNWAVPTSSSLIFDIAPSNSVNFLRVEASP